MTAPEPLIVSPRVLSLEAELLAAFDKGDMLNAVAVLGRLTAVDAARARYLLRLIAAVTDVVNHLTQEGRL